MNQTITLFVMGLKLLLARPGPGLIIIVGMAGLTAVVVSLFVVAEAFEKTLKDTGKANRALVLRAGSTSEINGNVPIVQYRLVDEMPEVGIASRETYVTVNLPQPDGTDTTVSMRGVIDRSETVRPEFQLVSGRAFTPGKYELIAGTRAAQLINGLKVGETLQIRGQKWLVTGLFRAEGSALETELWVDERLLAQSLGRGETFSSMLVQLNSAEEFEEFKTRLEQDRRLTVSAHRESDYYAEQAASTSGLIQGLGLLVGSIMALGAIVAAFNTMQSALQSRGREIATLRALGFKRGSLLRAILLECVALSLVGGGIAIAGVYLFLDGATLSTVAASTTSTAQVAFQFDVTLRALVVAAGLAIALGMLGGIAPGFGAVRRNLPRALRGG